jgi:hypothetical protein
MPKRKIDEIPTKSNRRGAEAEIKALREDLHIAQQKIFALTKAKRTYRIARGNKRRSYKFALTSDLHVGSLYANTEAFVEFVNVAYDEVVRDFYCSGDLIEGDSMFRGQVYELKDVGFARQLDALVKVTKQLPKKAQMHFVTGNHDASFAKQIGFDVGQYIAEATGWICVGRDSGTISIDLPGKEFRLALLHPDGGTAYALSYKAQKIIEAWEGGFKPHMISIGHFHKAEFILRYRNVKAVQAGTFQNQTPYMERKALAAHVGGWIVEIELGDLYNRTRPEFIEFF